MHRIDSPGSVDNRFQNGNPAIGQQATQLTADWFNDMQENVAFVIEDAGIALTKGDGEQLRNAIVSLIAGIVGTGGGSVPTTLTVTGGGLVTGGGDLTVNRVLSVTAASVPEVTAQVVNDKAVTPASLAGLISVTGAAGVMVLKVGSAVIQIFQASISANATTIVSLPESFPTEFIGAFVNGGEVDYGVQDNPPWASGGGLSNVSIVNAMSAMTAKIVAFGR